MRKAEAGAEAEAEAGAETEVSLLGRSRSHLAAMQGGATTADETDERCLN